MSIKIWNRETGSVFLRAFDQGIFDSIGAIPAPNPPGVDQSIACFVLDVRFPDNTLRPINVYFTQPEPIFRLKIFPFITVNRDDFSPAMHRWMNVGQLEHRVGVSGTQAVANGISGFTRYREKAQAEPNDIVYTISMYDRLENGVQPILLKMLRAFPAVGKLSVFDSRDLLRSYEAYREGSTANLQDLVDPVNRVRGYAITVRVEGELDLAEHDTTNAVSGFVTNLHRLR